MFARYQENFNSGTNKFKFIYQFKKSQDLGNISTFLGVLSIASYKVVG